MNPPQIEGMDDLPTVDQLVEESRKVALELAHAVYRHRKAWRDAITIKRRMVERHGPGPDTDIKCEGDWRYKRAMDDIKFWREEAQMHAAVLAALSNTPVLC